MDPLLPQGGDCCGADFDVLFEQVADTEAGEFSALTVHEERRFTVPGLSCALGELSQELRGLRPNRAESGLAALATQADLVGRLGSYVA